MHMMTNCSVLLFDMPYPKLICDMHVMLNLSLDSIIIYYDYKFYFCDLDLLLMNRSTVV